MEAVAQTWWQPWGVDPSTMLICAAAIVLAFWLWKQLAPKSVSVSSSSSRAPGEDAHLVIYNAAPSIPQGVKFRSSASEAMEYETDAVRAKVLIIHKPTRDPERLKSGDYPYADHMHHRKRLWEIRLQITLKRAIEGPVFLGVEQDKYHWPGWMQYQLGNAVAGTLKRCVGAIYKSVGDDPKAKSSAKLSELERPQFMFPVNLVFDEYLVTPEGDTPPDLSSSEFPKLGMTKADDRKAFKRAMNELSLEPGPTYTFGAWAVSQFVDAIKWIANGQDFRNFGIDPPCFFSMYALKPSPSGVSETRHLDSRKDYLWRSVYWSTEVPPKFERQRAFACPEDSPAESNDERNAQPNAKLKAKRGCCYCGMGSS